MALDEKTIQSKLDNLLENDHKHELDLVEIKGTNSSMSKDIEELKISVGKCVTNTEFSPFKNGILAGIGAILLAVMGALISLVVKK